MFGENVPKDVVDETTAIIASSDGVVAAGTSLQVYSIYRFVRLAHERGTRIAIVNVGPTRADDLANLHVPALTSQVFTRLAQRLAGTAARGGPSGATAAVARP